MNTSDILNLKLMKVINNDSAPILKLVKKKELIKLLETNNETPWYGQLMTTPQTIAYFVQFNYWLERYEVELTFSYT